AGVYTYAVAGAPPGVSASSTVTVTVNSPPNAGINGAITLCNSNAAISLFAQLTGGAQAGGTWNGPSPVAGGIFDPANMNAGVYSYTVSGTAPCPADVSTVTVTVNNLPDAGIDGGLVLCISSPTTALSTGLNGTPDAGGSWSGPGGASNGTFTPGVSATGIYTYTVAGIAPCPSASATVDVQVLTNPNPGTPGAITVCANAAPSLLFDVLGGTPDAGGTWSGPSPVVGGQYDPLTMTPGVYTYTITVPPPCVSASSTVTVAESAPSNAGPPVNITLCTSSASVSLFAQLGGAPQPGGTWSGPSPVVGGMLNPATMLAGVYTYTVVGIAPCPNATAAVTVTINTPPNAGTDGALTLCV
ncbi:MAG TPA: hypothetical protein PK760_15850, partial [Flavobacteriales bacterium]|nr:hypothetical protein [Flavobacteriales bacterium]